MNQDYEFNRNFKICKFWRYINSPIFGNVIFKELTYNLLTLSNLFYKGEISEKTL